MDALLFRGDHMVYLPKDQVVVRESIPQPGGTVLPSSVVDYFIEQSSFHLIMHRCICRESDNCQKFPHELGCIFLGEAVQRISPHLGRMVTKEEALAHARRCREAGLVQSIGRDRLDSIWLGAGPVGKLMTICHCCPCCCLFRILPDLRPDIAAGVQRMPGVSVWVGDECTGCGRCLKDVCFVEAISQANGRAHISDACRGCGRCVEVCAHGAIHLTIEDRGYIEQTITGISARVNLDGRLPPGALTEPIAPNRQEKLRSG